tara:strand:- start:368 stop:988 length:621 start_codon:yes stop_codon:yes gene_type:complete
MASIVLAGSSSGTLTVAAPAAAGSNTLTLPASTSTIATTADVNALTTGKILQVISATKTDTQSITARGLPLTDVVGLSISITPSATSSKILVLANINLGANQRYTGVVLYNGSTALCIGDSSGSRQPISAGIANSAATNDIYQVFPTAINFLHSPSSTSAQTYKIGAGQVYSSGTGTVYVNRSSNDGNAAYISRTASTITVMEVAG